MKGKWERDKHSKTIAQQAGGGRARECGSFSPAKSLGRRANAHWETAREKCLFSYVSQCLAEHAPSGSFATPSLERSGRPQKIYLIKDVNYKGYNNNRLISKVYPKGKLNILYVFYFIFF